MVIFHICPRTTFILFFCSSSTKPTTHPSFFSITISLPLLSLPPSFPLYPGQLFSPSTSLSCLIIALVTQQPSISFLQCMPRPLLSRRSQKRQTDNWIRIQTNTEAHKLIYKHLEEHIGPHYKLRQTHIHTYTFTCHYIYVSIENTCREKRGRTK